MSTVTVVIPYSASIRGVTVYGATYVSTITVVIPYSAKF